MPGGGGGGTTQTTSTSNVDMGPWKEQQPWLSEIFRDAHQAFANTNGQLKYYPDSTVSPATQGQNQGYQNIVNRGLTGSPWSSAFDQNVTDTMQGKYLDPSTNPWLSKTFDSAADAVTRQFKTATAPTTDSFFAGNGAYNGSARYNAQNNNNMGLGQTLNNLANSIYGGNYQNERGIQSNMVNNNQGLSQSAYVDPFAAVSGGTGQQQQNQAQLTDQVNRFNYNQMSPFQTLGIYKSLIDGNYGQSGTTSTTSQQPYYSNPLGSAIGGGLSLLGTIGSLATPGAGGISAFGNIFSDARLKEDISAPVGMTFDGVPIRAWRYKGDPEPRVGVIAQEVERVKPDAVVEHASGFKMVNLDRALGRGPFN